MAINLLIYSSFNHFTMDLINLCEHTINVFAHAESKFPILVIEPSGVIARCATEKTADRIYMEGTETPIPVIKIKYGQITGLPEPIAGVFYIVSRIVAEAAKDRTDLFFPGERVVDPETRQQIGCVGLSIVN